MPKKQ